MTKPPALDVGPDSMLLTDRVAVVTGAAQGIGEAIAVGLARFGADVALCDRDEAGLASTAVAVERHGRRATTATLDVRDGEAMGEWFEQIEADHGHVDILVNNAGGGFFASFLDVSPKGQAALVDENFTSVTSGIRAAVPLMGERGGSIINVTSIEAHRAGPGFAVYSAMKAAVENLTRSLALELAARRIRVNCIAPDMIPTPGDDGLSEDAAAVGEQGWSKTIWPDMGSVEDCAAAAVFLAGDFARFLTGTTIHPDGGNLAASGWKRTDDGGFVL